MTTDRIDRAVRLLRLNDLEDGLRHALDTDSKYALAAAEQLRDADGTGVAEALAELLPGAKLTSTAPRYEMALLWAPLGVPVTIHVYLNKTLVPGAAGTFRGGRVFFAVPEEMIREGDNFVVIVVRFWQSGWRYQFWTRDGDDRRRVDLGRDPDASKSDDDRFVKQFTFRGDES